MKQKEEKCLMIMEVSQKQAYIFRSKKLANNILASDIIRYLTSSEFLKAVGKDMYDEEQNLVYAGGGHTILLLDNQVKARELAMRVSKYVLKKFKDLEMMIKLMEYPEYPQGGSLALEKLIQELEMKKALKQASFHQGKFGFEKVDLQEKDKISEFEENLVKGKSIKFEDNIAPYKFVKQFEELGGVKNDSNFISVVHIDGNSMGKKVAEFDSANKDIKFDTYRKKKKEFSEKIDFNFQDSLKKMMIERKEWLDEFPSRKETIGIKDNHFPIRSIIAAGDDICFVTEGKIGVECAVSFMKNLFQNSSGEYSACAGVAIVHKKYPFYKAYELAEELCSNAKKTIAQMKEGANVCAIDWHVEFGEISGKLSDIREQYVNNQKEMMIGRPYVVCGDEELVETDYAQSHNYTSWKCVVDMVQNQDDLARGKLKALREYVKVSDASYKKYLELNRIEQYEDIDRKQLFDAIEIMDTYIG